ncbi:hypothetical protein SY83_16565 [Paenibacillus swuensis]|uniref:DUF4345 domain-containing protein n=1 Tax=Paenibacillus swuensis TaxID=1178515 RepID=A0A172TKS4_9BACL|nr:hypothetical protein [Paenibacillus swuensis]ANE47630.1 hypothetical protein SY83_16565 [Paenibacillus swuensis]
MTRIVTIPWGSAMLSGWLAIITGSLYLDRDHFRFAILGNEAGSQWEAVSFWSDISIGLGVAVLGLLLLRRLHFQISNLYIPLFLIILALIQIAPLGLWAMLGLLSGDTESWEGVGIHAVNLLIMMIAAIRFRSLWNSSREN